MTRRKPNTAGSLSHFSPAFQSHLLQCLPLLSHIKGITRRATCFFGHRGCLFRAFSGHTLQLAAIGGGALGESVWRWATRKGRQHGRVFVPSCGVPTFLLLRTRCCPLPPLCEQQDQQLRAPSGSPRGPSAGALCLSLYSGCFARLKLGRLFFC